MTKNTVRLRQEPPRDFNSKTFRTIQLTDGIQAVMGCPKNKLKMTNTEKGSSWCCGSFWDSNTIFNEIKMNWLTKLMKAHHSLKFFAGTNIYW